MFDASKGWELNRKALLITSPISYLIVEGIEKAIKQSSTVSENGNIEAMRKEAVKQELSQKMAIAQAKVAQEISIARRIDTAEEVVIEEFYDASGEGGIKASVEGESVIAGISGSGRRVTKRVYTFKGWRDGGLEAIEKAYGNQDSV